MLHFSSFQAGSGEPYFRLAAATNCRSLANSALAALALLTAAPAWAQETFLPAPVRQPVLVNLKGGFNLSTYTGGGYIGWETGLKGGFSAGLSATRALSARSAWQVELLYSRKGAVAYDYWHTYAAPPPPLPQAITFIAPSCTTSTCPCSSPTALAVAAATAGT